jgi:hypothetical protein
MRGFTATGAVRVLVSGRIAGLGTGGGAGGSGAAGAKA